MIEWARGDQCTQVKTESRWKLLIVVVPAEQRFGKNRALSMIQGRENMYIVNCNPPSLPSHFTILIPFEFIWPLLFNYFFTDLICNILSYYADAKLHAMYSNHNPLFLKSHSGSYSIYSCIH